ncbi:MAG: cation-translocating P-type ATPase [Defluviitaleaceae bacterium]|nr:cation-translocating P-type ATPase [Defluviitaleaceae bacterium]
MYAKTKEEALRELGTDVGGLSEKEATARLEKYGENRLESAKKKPLVWRILAQFKDFLVLILLAAAGVSIFFGDGLKDAILIFGILLVNVIISITQENRADNALRELKNMSAPKAKVRRGGAILKIESKDVVPGDIVLLDAGDFVSADLRIIDGQNLKIDEAALTGESLPVSKNSSDVFDEDAPLGDRKNSAFTGTVVTYGRGEGVVCATGMQTEMGKIAALLNEQSDTATPLQEKLDAMAKVLGVVCIVICAAIFAIGFLWGMEPLEMLMVSVSLAVAAVPEGIAIVATVILAIGVQKMVRSNVIVKRLRAVETLGSTTVICSDKTGTLTQNRMTVVKTLGTLSPNPRELFEKSSIKTDMDAKMLKTAVLCNDAILGDGGKNIGDPTEIAMLVFAAENGVSRDDLNAQFPRVGEIPFDSERKMMSVLNNMGEKIVMHTKGAPDAIISRSSHALQNGEIVEMTEDLRRDLIAQNEKFASEALRVLAFAWRECEDAGDCAEENLIFAGLMGLIDPPREEAAAAVAECRTAGISVKMITGDHKITALAIARLLGIAEEGDGALSGADLDALGEDELREKVREISVFARVSPEHKVRIVSAIKANGDIAAMTGDGVNDAPSLKKADIGIAMGITGTDVSKEAADMILTDDNFASIVKAVEQGRTIYGNIRKVTGYLLSCNIGEILVLFVAIAAGLPVPLAATQLLFVNLLTDAFPAFALGMEGKESSVMRRPPRPPKEAIINRSMRGSVAVRAGLLFAAAFGAFLYGLYFFDEIVAASMCFFTLVAAELLVSFTAKTETFAGISAKSLKNLFANKFLNISMVLSLAILFAVMYVPFLGGLFQAVPLTASQLAVCGGLILIPLLGGEIAKKYVLAATHC